MAIYGTKAGNRLPVMPITTNADLTGATFDAMRFQLKDESEASFVGVPGNLTIASSGASGSVVNYAWAVAETDITPGLYKGEIDVSLAGKPMTVPGVSYFEFRIYPKIEAP